MKFGVPAVRMDVTPDSSRPCAAFAAYCTVCSAIVAAAMRGHSRCTCTSHKPGRRYPPGRSMICAPAGPLRPDGAISAIRPFAIVTVRSGATPGAAPPITFAFASTRVMGVPLHDVRGFGFQSKQDASGGLERTRMDADVLGDGVHVSEGWLDRTRRVARGRAPGEVDEVDGLRRARARVPARQPHVRPVLDPGAPPREHVMPDPLGSVEQVEPSRAH